MSAGCIKYQAHEENTNGIPQIFMVGSIVVRNWLLALPARGFLCRCCIARFFEMGKVYCVVLQALCIKTCFVMAWDNKDHLCVCAGVRDHVHFWCLLLDMFCRSG